MQSWGYSGRRDERGAVAIMFAVATTFLFVLAAMVVDLGLARDTRQQSQNSADASALAAANALYPTSGTCAAANPGGGTTSPCFTDSANAAKTYALNNFNVSASAWTACTDSGHYYVPAGISACISFTDSTGTSSVVTAPTKVRVMVPTKNVHFGIGAVTGKTGVDIETMAEVSVSANTNYNCALCFLGPVTSGNGDVTVTGGGIQVSGGLDIGSQAYWTASSAIGVSGTFSGTTAHVSPSLANPKPPSFTDPLASMSLPSLSGTNRTGTTQCKDTTIQPGIYHNLSLGNKDTCTLASGNYVITGTWSLGNNSVLQGTGVTLFFTCGTSGSPSYCASGAASGGKIDGKNGTVALSAGGPGWTSYVLVYDRNNPSDVMLQGNGGTSLTGSVYAPNADLDFNGNSCFGFSGGPIIVKGINKGNGNKSCITVTQASDTTVKSVPGQFALSK